jgi:deferrochelatase/peroxidase EfeB
MGTASLRGISMTKPAAVDFEDIQGLVRFAYAALTEAEFLLLRMRDVSAAKAWLASAPVSNAIKLSKAPDTALQIAFTSEGLRALGLPENVLSQFSAEFYAGMSEDPSRSRRLGDIGESAPEHWEWGGNGDVPHLVAMIYARDNQLEPWSQSIRGPLWDKAFDVIESLPTSNLYGVEPFGFTDGISQPTIDWERQRQIKGDQLEYGNLVTLGEFLLGYPNEYDKYTDRPLLPAGPGANTALPLAEDHPDMYDMGRNGSFLVLRQLDQDVRGFWQFNNQQVKSDPQARTRLAELMVGRTQKGEPLAPLSASPIEGISADNAPLNQFTFDADAQGTHCPFGAHIRRANPRTNDLPGASDTFFSRLTHTLGFEDKEFNQDVIASTRFHRLLRRGREYGPGLSVEESLQPAPLNDAERGIHFICIGANISRQFEFVQNAWVMSSKFGGLTDESDPLLGNRAPIAGCPVTDTFSLPQQAGAPRVMTGIPRFVTVRGGAYFFLPSIRTLRYLSQL